MDDLDLGSTIKGFLPGQKVFTRYTLTRLLGRGGMGVVWLARDDKLERDVALKFLPEVMMGDKLALADLKRETRRSLELTHPHIVRIYDFVDDARTAGIAMEYIAGDTLGNARVDKPGRFFEVAELSSWVAQLCAALEYAHGKAQVVHRDLKPANLMIDARGDLKVTDFGIASSISESVSRVSKQAGTSGTPVYMSPQQMMGEKPSVSDDIYALGATLYDLLTGKPPFHSGNILMQVQTKVPPAIAARRADLGHTGAAIPAEWEATLAACLAKDPAGRPQSAGEVAERLGLGPGGVRKAEGGGRQPPKAEAAKPEVRIASKPGASIRYDGLESRRSDPKKSNHAAIAAAALAVAGLGWYFGVHQPEQSRLAEIARVEAEERAAGELRLRNEQEKAAAAAQRRANARGGVVVRTRPAGAEVRIGAAALDKSPFTLRDQKLGKYPVRVRLDGYEDWSGEVEVKENEFTDLEVTLVRSTGTIELESTPLGAEVWRDGERVGTTPYRVEKAETGTHSYELRLAGYESFALRGVVEAGSTLRRSVALAPKWPQAGRPWENSLGQKFESVPGTGVLFCIWETRESDYGAFVRATGRGWSSASAGPNHPAVNVSWDDAKAFCAWLTEKERGEGRLGPNQSYRLPTDAEWSLAVGLTEGAGTPREKHAKERALPWGSQWPPPAGAGNYLDESAKRSNPGWTVIRGYDDGYPGTAPVGSFSANRFGLHDLGGNVWEWCEDFYDGSNSGRVLRGAGFLNYPIDHLYSSVRASNNEALRNGIFGFRVVVVIGPPSR